MNTTRRSFSFLASLTLAAILLLANLTRAHAAAIWEAFNDYSPGPLTHTNATGYKLRIDADGGILRNFATGSDLPVSVTVETEGGTPDDFGARGGAPDAGSPAMLLFDGKVDLANDGLPGVHETIKLTLLFSGLDRAKVYKFCGTVARGGNYNNRWSVYTITGVSNAVAAHLDGSANQNIFTAATYPAAAADLAPNQVALNAGHNKQGSVVCWDKIEPAADGTFRVEALRYLGKTPFGSAADSGTSYSYGFEAIYLAEFASSGNLRITENPLSQKVPAGKTAVLTVVATSTQPITYQWQKATPGSTNFTDIPTATQATYTTPVLTVADDGSQFRCNLTSGAANATSGEATIQVDGVIPTLTSAKGSINLNSIYVTFSEAMKLDQLANQTNYTLSGGLSLSNAVGLSSTTARLLTSRQSTGTVYSVTINNIEDVAGNKIAANTTGNFTSFSVQSNTVGLEVWLNIGGAAVLDLRNDPRYPNAPDVDYATTTFDSFLVIPAVPDLNTYGARFRAWLTPEETADYEFFIRSDGGSELRLSMDDKFDNLDDPNGVPDAIDATAGDPFQEPGVDQSVSLPLHLEKGKRYAVQVIWKESNGPDYCQVAWRKIGDTTPADQLQPIPSRFLSYYGPGAVTPPTPSIAIARQGNNALLTWTGTLQSSDDLRTWRDETTAVSPLPVTPSQPLKFYRAKN